ncbi:MAG: hypothetical protein CL947_01085 [Epsilonproteobacteria bacterium]|nr:hypothetical protein [Campylobacterota bacterium]
MKLSLPFQLLLVLGFVVFFGCKLDLCTIQFFYTLSLTLKECLSFLLPFIVFSFISSGILSFKKNAPTVIGILLSCILISNATIAFFAYFVSTSILKGITNGVTIHHLTTNDTLTPLWSFCLPRIITSEHAMLLAIIVGIGLSFMQNKNIEQSIHRFKQTIEWILNTLFIPILPLYITGFLLDIYHQGVFLQLFTSYGKTFALIFGLHIIVIFLIYLLASMFKPQRAMYYINTALPSYLTAFGTMSSTAAIPVTVNCATKNTGNKPLAQVAAPILANVHLLGDAISTPVLAITTLFLFHGTVPTLTTFATFVTYFCLTMLAVSGVPGGGIIVMIPILKGILGFSDAMISIITTLYLLQDAFGTAANVMGDGALMIIVNKLLHKLGIK